jgi:hypothetical protein
VTLVELTPDRAFTDVPVTTFAAEGIWERADLQAAIRDRIDVLGDERDSRRGPVRTSSGPAPCGHSQPTPSPSRSRCRP